MIRKTIEEQFKLFQNTIKKYADSCSYNVAAPTAARTLISYEFLFRNVPLLIAVTRERVEHIKTKDMLLCFSKVMHHNMGYLTAAVATSIATTPVEHKRQIDVVRNQMKSAVLFLEECTHFSEGKQGLFILALLEEVQHQFANLFVELCVHRLSPKIDAQYFRNLVIRNLQFDFRHQLQSAAIDSYGQDFQARQGKGSSSELSNVLDVNQLQHTVPKIVGVVKTIFSPLSIAFAEN